MEIKQCGSLGGVIPSATLCCLHRERGTSSNYKNFGDEGQSDSDFDVMQEESENVGSLCSENDHDELD